MPYKEWVDRSRYFVIGKGVALRTFHEGTKVFLLNTLCYERPGVLWDTLNFFHPLKFFLPLRLLKPLPSRLEKIGLFGNLLF